METGKRHACASKDSPVRCQRAASRAAPLAFPLSQARFPLPAPPQVRKAVIGAILATDMVHHFPMVSRLEVGTAPGGGQGPGPSALAVNPAPPPAPFLAFDPGGPCAPSCLLHRCRLCGLRGMASTCCGTSLRLCLRSNHLPACCALPRGPRCFTSCTPPTSTRTTAHCARARPGEQ